MTNTTTVQALDDKQTNRRARKTAACLGVLSMLFLQLAIASHEFDHVAGDVTDSCYVCVQLERFEDGALAPKSTYVSIAPMPYPFAMAEAQAVARQPLRGCNSRAPPTL